MLKAHNDYCSREGEKPGNMTAMLNFDPSAKWNSLRQTESADFWGLTSCFVAFATFNNWIKGLSYDGMKDAVIDYTHNHNKWE